MTMSIFEYVVVLGYFGVLLWMLLSQRDKITSLEEHLQHVKNEQLNTPNYKEHRNVVDRVDAITNYLEINIVKVPDHYEVKERVNT